MKTIKSLLIASSLILASSAFADNMAATDIAANWACTTNASSASTDADKLADEQMAKNYTSASKAFDAAAQNCRDCTKITCESKK
ncbi:MAG: hypothetical protein H0U70_02325 [Tatlockia sp.]|nr:hypothetical protein [Tatlockia sp.]